MTNPRIGISGWSYPEWRGGGFYPPGLSQKLELAYAAARVNSIEINGTFYKLQTPASFQKWAAETPEDFLFAIKGSKYITHQKKLIDIRLPLANFFASGLLALGRKLGPILWQFPPWYRFSRERIESFLKVLPTNTAEASLLAGENTIRDKENAFSDLTENIKLRYTFEPRHESFFTGEFIELLRDHNAALTVADTAGKFRYAEDITADFVYIRLHGSTEIYSSDYTDEELGLWAAKIRSWIRGAEPRGTTKITKGKFEPGRRRDAYVYFDNDIRSHAPYDAMHLASLLGVKNKAAADSRGQDPD